MVQLHVQPGWHANVVHQLLARHWQCSTARLLIAGCCSIDVSPFLA
jgi:hypothetical protein